MNASTSLQRSGWLPTMATTLSIGIRARLGRAAGDVAGPGAGGGAGAGAGGGTGAGATWAPSAGVTVSNATRNDLRILNNTPSGNPWSDQRLVVSCFGSGTAVGGCPAVFAESDFNRICEASIRARPIASLLMSYPYFSRRADWTGSVTSTY